MSIADGLLATGGLFLVTNFLLFLSHEMGFLTSSHEEDADRRKNRAALLTLSALFFFAAIWTYVLT